jgi:hypothetical protein
LCSIGKRLAGGRAFVFQLSKILQMVNHLVHED